MNAITAALSALRSLLKPAAGKEGGKYDAKHAGKFEAVEDGKRVVYYVSRYEYPSEETAAPAAPAVAKAPAKRSKAPAMAGAQTAPAAVNDAQKAPMAAPALDIDALVAAALQKALAKAGLA